MAEKEIKHILLQTFNKQYPDSPLEIMSESELAEIPGWITTGNYALNWIISKSLFKGLPMGRIVALSGDPSSGKSMIALSMMREPSIDSIIYFDTEGGGATTDFAKFLGIDPNKILYSTIDTIEELINKMRTVIDIIEKNKTKQNVLMIVDSISMISTEREKDPEGGSDMGNKAKQTRAFFRTYMRKMQKLNICTVFTAHLTQNIGGYGPREVVSGGGTILGYAPTVEVRFSSVDSESEIERSARGASVQKIRAEIVKSRMGTKGKRVKFDVDMQNGLDLYAGIFDILKDYQFIIPASADLEKQIEEKNIPKKASGGWYVFKPWVGEGKKDDYETSELTVKMHEKLIAEKQTSNGKFHASAVTKFCKECDWFLADVQTLLDTIYPADAIREKEKIENVENTKTKKKKKSEEVIIEDEETIKDIEETIEVINEIQN